MIGNIEDTNKLQGTLKTNVNIQGSINSQVAITGNLINGARYRNYNGDYEITPTIIDQTLQTRNKVLNQDILINRIPYREENNDFGKTIYIGSEGDSNGN